VVRGVTGVMSLFLTPLFLSGKCGAEKSGSGWIRAAARADF